MRVLINNKLYDSTTTPILIVFDDNERSAFLGLERYVSAPKDSTDVERSKLIQTDIHEYCAICGVKMLEKWSDGKCIHCSFEEGE